MDAPTTLDRAIALGAEPLADAVAKSWGDDVGYALAPGGFVLAIAAAQPTSV
ncbi:hypothetical protein [Cellulosimicrobium sp. NPDC055967]|uniref:hypothetical protein n=1 Tax=Cellulosimicrobium sp. NPDC055967 TaxID=3345670 RepID=UPI0035D8131D